MHNIDNPEDIKGWSNSISINFTGLISVSGSADFSDNATNAGFSESVGSGAGAAGSVAYTRGYTIVAKTIPELLSKIAIPNSKLRNSLIKELKKLDSKRSKK